MRSGALDLCFGCTCVKPSWSITGDGLDGLAVRADELGRLVRAAGVDEDFLGEDTRDW